MDDLFVCIVEPSGHVSVACSIHHWRDHRLHNWLNYRLDYRLEFHRSLPTSTLASLLTLMASTPASTASSTLSTTPSFNDNNIWLRSWFPFSLLYNDRLLLPPPWPSSLTVPDHDHGWLLRLLWLLIHYWLLDHFLLDDRLFYDLLLNDRPFDYPVLVDRLFDDSLFDDWLFNDPFDHLDLRTFRLWFSFGLLRRFLFLWRLRRINVLIHHDYLLRHHV